MRSKSCGTVVFEEIRMLLQKLCCSILIVKIADSLLKVMDYEKSENETRLFSKDYPQLYQP